MMPQSVVCWKWKPPAHYRSVFPPETVNVLRRMVLRHYGPIRFICVTDDRAGLDPDIEVLPDWGDFRHLPSPHGGKNPSCYRRLRMFHPDIGAVFGPRFVSLDLDTVITGDLRTLWDRPEDFVIYGDTNRRTFYNGSMVLMSAGARPQVWTNFNPAKSPQLSKAAGRWGSDQGWISYCLGPGEQKWSRADGVYSFRNDLQHVKALPENAKLVVFHGRVDPWQPQTQASYPWVKQHWC